MIPHQKPSGFMPDKMGYPPPSPSVEHVQPESTQMGVRELLVQSKPPLASHNDVKSPEVLAAPKQKPSFQGSVQGLAFSNPFGTQSQPYIGNKQMARSYMKSPQNDLESFKKEMLIKFHEVNRTLSEHGQQLNELKQNTLNMSSSTIDLKPDPISSDMLRNMRKDFEFDHQTLHNRMLHEIETIRSEINDRYLRKQEFESNLTRFDARIADNYQTRKDHTKDFNQVREKCMQECRNLYEFFRKEIESNIHHIHEANRVVFNKIEKDMIDIRQTSESQKIEFAKLKTTCDPDVLKGVITSGRKFYDPRIIRYKEVMQRVSDRPYQKGGEEVIINEVVYYLDRDGYLLDKNSHYLVDPNGQQIQLQQKHMNVLKFYSLLQ